MNIWTCMHAHTTEYDNPIELTKGEVVKLGDRATEDNWKDWIWAENEKLQGGWIPIQIIENFDDSKPQGIITEDYSARELNVSKGERVVKLKSLNGWSWVRKVNTDEEGWIPDETIEKQINEC